MSGFSCSAVVYMSSFWETVRERNRVWKRTSDRNCLQLRLPRPVNALAAHVQIEGPLAKIPHLSICFNSKHNLPGVTEPQGCPSLCQYTHTCIGIPFVSTWLGFCSIHKNTIPVYLIDCQTSPAVFAWKCAGAFRLCQISHAPRTAVLSGGMSVLYRCPGHRPWWRVWSTNKQVRGKGDRSLTGLLSRHSGDLWSHLSPWTLASFHFNLSLYSSRALSWVKYLITINVIVFDSNAHSSF